MLRKENESEKTKQENEEYEYKYDIGEYKKSGYTLEKIKALETKLIEAEIAALKHKAEKEKI